VNPPDPKPLRAVAALARKLNAIKGKAVIKVTSITQTSGACPSQWEGITEDGRPIYVRYRWGYLSIRLGGKDGNIRDAVSGKEIIGKQIGGPWDGVLSYEGLKKATQGKIQWPEHGTCTRRE